MLFTVPITRRSLEIYVVDAKSRTEAAMQVGMAQATNVPPHIIQTTSITVSSPNPIEPENAVTMLTGAGRADVIETLHLTPAPVIDTHQS